MLSAALELAAAGWPVFPCHGKAPLTPHGFKDATTDPATIDRWWHRWPAATIGGAIPESLIVIDVDPRAGGRESLELLEAYHRPLPTTLRSFTGGGGEHLFFIRPPGPLRNGSHKLGPGIDVKLGGKGYVVLPPSVHPNGTPYRWDDPEIPIAAMPGWMAALLRPEPIRPQPEQEPVSGLDGPRPGDLLAAEVTWAEILEPFGWRLVGRRGEIEYWRRPGKDDEGISATVNALGTDRLHVFSSSAYPFAPDESYSKFGAWTVLHAGGDFAEAARRLRKRSVEA